MNAAALFVWTLALMFGFSFVTSARLVLAFFMAFAIGACYLVVFRLHPMATQLEVWAYLLGGPVGLVAGLAARRYWSPNNRRRRRVKRAMRESDYWHRDDGNAADSLYDARAPWQK